MKVQLQTHLNYTTYVLGEGDIKMTSMVICSCQWKKKPITLQCLQWTKELKIKIKDYKSKIWDKIIFSRASWDLLYGKCCEAPSKDFLFSFSFWHKLKNQLQERTQNTTNPGDSTRSKWNSRNNTHLQPIHPSDTKVRHHPRISGRGWSLSCI